MSAKIALMIDAENISHKSLPRILNLLPIHGRISLHLIYGDWEQGSLKTWQGIAGQHQFTCRHQTNAKNVKNAADMQLIMDAMDILHHRKDIDIFCLVTNDADYVPLCNKIHEANKYIIGMGYRLNAADRLIRSCDQFAFIGEGKQPAKKSPRKSSSQKSNLRELVTEAITVASPNGTDRVSLSTIGTTLRQIQPGFRSKNYGHSKLINLLKSMPDLVEIQKKGGSHTARLKQKVFNQNKLKKLLLSAFELVPHHTEGWVTLSAIGTALRKAQPGFEPKKYGNARLSRLLVAMPDFIELRMIDGVQYARLK